MVGEITDWIGLGLTSLGMAMAGAVYVQNEIKNLRDKTEARMVEQKKELKTQHAEDLARVERAVDEERTERRRELDRMEKTIEGFADVASAVIGMGKSIEHLTEKFADHQKHNDRALDELKHSIRGMDQKIEGLRYTPSRRARSAKKEGA